MSSSLRQLLRELLQIHWSLTRETSWSRKQQPLKLFQTRRNSTEGVTSLLESLGEPGSEKATHDTRKPASSGIAGSSTEADGSQGSVQKPLQSSCVPTAKPLPTAFADVRGPVMASVLPPLSKSSTRAPRGRDGNVNSLLTRASGK